MVKFCLGCAMFWGHVRFIKNHNDEDPNACVFRVVEPSNESADPQASVCLGKGGAHRFAQYYVDFYE